MNKNLIFKLSLFGLAMAVSTVFFIPSKVEPFFWITIILICAYQITKKCTSLYFLNGLCVGLVNCVWITLTHILLFNTYIANHPEEAAVIKNMPLHDSPKLLMLLTGIVFGIVSGLLLGLLSFFASKIEKTN